MILHCAADTPHVAAYAHIFILVCDYVIGKMKSVKPNSIIGVIEHIALKLFLKLAELISKK